MKSKRFISLSILSILSVGLLAGVTVYNSNSVDNNEALVAEAWDINVKPNVKESYYSAADGKTGSALKSALAGFNNPKNKSYDWSRYEAADEAQDDSTSILCLYTRHNIKKNSHCGSYSWDKWNREHVYTQTAFPNSKTDNHNIFACEGEINNQRGNKPYANLKGKGGNQVTVHGHLTNCYQTSSLFEPCDEAKGEVARACLYCTVYYGYSLSSIFDSIDTALEWNAKYTVTPREIYRNNVVYGLQGNRNPFVDHPSYAQAIYGGPDYEGIDPLSPEEPVSVTGVSLDQTSGTIDMGDTLQLTATVTPSNATVKRVTWSSSNSSIATVNDSGLVTGKSQGNATITATTVDGGYTATCAVTVNQSEPKLISITLSGNYQTQFNVNETFAYKGLVVTANYNIGNSKVVTDYTVSSPDMSTAGEKTVTVSYTEDNVTQTASYTITVVNPFVPVKVESITLNKDIVDMLVGERFRLVATVKPDDATDKRVVWSAEPLQMDELVVSVDNNGVVTALAEGYAKVTATSTDDEEISASAIIRIRKEKPSPSSSGCGGSIATTSVILSSLSILGLGLLLIKRRFHR